MKPEKTTEIFVATVFDGKRNSRDIFIDLILHRQKLAAKPSQLAIDARPPCRYTDAKVFSDVRVDREEKVA